METKGLLQSTTFYGSLITAVPAIIGILTSGLPPVVQAGTALLGSIIALFGRIRATTQISGLF